MNGFRELDAALPVLLESLPEVSAKLKEPNTAKDRKFEDVVKEAESATALAACRT